MRKLLAGLLVLGSFSLVGPTAQAVPPNCPFGPYDDYWVGGGSNQTKTDTSPFEKDCWDGAGGADDLSGSGMADYIYGGPGNDDLNGGDQPDTVRGEGGNDTVKGGSGDDSLWGGDSGDTILGQDGDDSLLEGGGQVMDLVEGGPGNDTFFNCPEVGYDVNEINYAESHGVENVVTNPGYC
jgi:hypothetical protein